MNQTDQGPFHLLIRFEHAKRCSGRLDAADEEHYTALIEVLHKMSDADQGHITEGLVTLAIDMNYPGAARALRGLRLPHRRRQIVSLIEMYPEDPKVKEQSDDERRTHGPRQPHPAYNLPLVLSETNDLAEIQLLAQCSRFQRPDGTRTPDDILFCTNAIEALSTIHSPIAQEALIVALASDTDAIFEAAKQSLRRNCSNDTRALCRELLAISKQEAIRKLSRMEGKGRFAALRSSYFQASGYDRFFSTLQIFGSR